MGNFSEIINSNKPTLVDFYADWCGPCKMMKPILDDLKKSVGNKVTILKIDVDKNPGASRNYQVQGVPTLILFQNGKILWRQSGVMQASALKQIIESKTHA
jgi:thioredoxin 1